MRIPLLLALLIIPLTGTAFADSQILSTDVGSLDVKVFTISKPSTGEINLNVDFLNKQTQKIQQHIDYTVLVTNDDNSIFQTIGLTHTSKGSISIPIDFPQSGDYKIDITIQGILFQPIPTESVSLNLPITVQTPIEQPSIEMLCHQGISIKVISTDIPEHLKHGDVYGECKTEQIVETKEVPKNIVDEVLVDIPTQELTETMVQKPPTIELQDNTVSEAEKILTPEETNSFVDLIIDIMNSIFSLVYELEDNPKLEQWASDVIQKRSEKTQDKIYSQLEATRDISQLKAESDKNLNYPVAP